MPHPFRFGVQLTKLPADGWRDQVRRIESMGFSTVFFPDHFHDQLDPTAALASIGAVTSQLRVGTLVYDVDYRHPVVFAKQAATIQLLSGGRHEFGIGAGWMESDYVEAGLAYDRPGIRIDRLEEALQIIRGMWTQERTSFEGRHYTVREVARAAAGLEPADAPKILIGGGGRRVLSLAGRFADIVGINPKMKHGEIVPETPADLAPDKVREKVGWVREAAAAAGRDAAAIEFNSLAFVVAISDDPSGIREVLGKRAGMTADEVADCPIFLTGSAREIRERLEKRREETGISYVVISQQDSAGIETFAEAVVEPLRGK
jgi:probable F420-dependent oxidoreductase